MHPNIGCMHNIHNLPEFFYLPLITPNSNDHGVITMGVDVICVLLRENDLGFWCICLTLTFNVRRVLYIQDFMSVPPASGDSLPASSELRLSIALNSMELAPSTSFEPHHARFSS